MRTLVLAVLILFAGQAFAEIPAQWVDQKYCGPPKRDANGEIVRSKTAIKYFRIQNPCPSTRLTFGPCPFHEIDHPRPLARCGCDTPTNMQWLKTSIKSCVGTECKDRWELSAYQCKPEDQ